MSVTYTCKRMANAFMGLDHERIYLLSETTYEGNVYPHTRHTRFGGFGKLPSIMQRIFHLAACTEGGGLNSPDKKMTPERYIKSCLNALKKPFAYDGDAPLDLASCWYAEKRLEALKADINQGREKVATVANSLALVEKHRASFALPPAFSDDGHVNYFQPASSELAYHPKLAKDLPTIDYPAFAKTEADGSEWYFQIDAHGNSISNPQWQYAFMGDFVINQWERELAFPGAYMESIPTYRKILNEASYDNAKTLCSALSIEEKFTDKTEDYKAYKKREQEEIVAQYGRQFPLSSVRRDDLYMVMSSRVLNFTVHP